MICFLVEKSGFSLEVQNFMLFRWKPKWFFVGSQIVFGSNENWFLLKKKQFFVAYQKFYGFRWNLVPMINNALVSQTFKKLTFVR